MPRVYGAPWNKLDPAERKRRRAARDKAWRLANPEKRRRNSYKFYGYPEPTRPMPATCECCGALPGKKGLALDHDHTTNKFRGWLCSNCNTAIGKLGDSLTGVLKAAAYLGRLA